MAKPSHSARDDNWIRLTCIQALKLCFMNRSTVNVRSPDLQRAINESRLPRGASIDAVQAAFHVAVIICAEVGIAVSASIRLLSSWGP
ncbi:MAG: hypothetical protein QM647_15830 [Asticcacaulis sp.]|uniref:hypothetical protein n=1 Tax=Asticcacaulis sp. TaxID=1872648 RepID=UPI0039E23664